MKALIVTLLLLSSPAIFAAPLLDANVRAMITARIAIGEMPSVVVGIIDGTETATYGFGTVAGAVPDGQSVYEIGSVTKTFTALLLAQAVEKKMLALDQPLSTLLPATAIPSYAGQNITLLDLATQSSGLPRLPNNMAPKNPEDPYADYGPAELRAFLGAYQLPRAPGARYEYSNLGFGLLGYALAAHAHKPYAQLVREQISEPLGMTSTDTALSPAMRAHLAPGHTAGGTETPNWDMNALAGAGAIRSNLADMLRYLQAHMAAAGKSDSAYALVQQPRRPAGGGNIGLAWHMREVRGVPVVWHNGMTGGYASYVGFSADGKRGVVVMTNSAVSVDSIATAALVPGAPAERVAVTLAPEALAQYSGRYQLKPDLVVSVRASPRRLTIQATNQPAFTAYASAADEFFLRDFDAQFSFVRDKAGLVQAMTWHQAGSDIHAEKLPTE